jgi:hypothetical protein
MLPKIRNSAMALRVFCVANGFFSEAEDTVNSDQHKKQAW